MRRYEALKKDLDYLQDPDEHPQGVNTLTLMAETMIDIREILLDIAEQQGVGVESFFDEPGEEDFQPEADGAGVSQGGGDEPPQDSVDDEISPGSDSWLAYRAAQLRTGLHDSPDS